MTPEIKQRIEQIRNDEVPEGYTKTKHGIFPSHWKVDKLGNYLQEYRELTNEIEKYPVYSSSRKGLLPQSQYYDKREVVTTNLGYKKVPNGYVTYRHMSDDDIFRFNKNTTDDTVLVSSEYPVFNCNTNGDIDYILPLLNDSPRFKYYCRIQKMGGTRTRLYYKNLCQYTTAFPPLKEQQKIANILSAQDKVIECYEKKIEQLKRMKKYYLQNMFPKRGETVPKIRFKGFTDPWKQRELGECMETVTDYVAAGSFADIADHVQYKNSPDFAQLIRTADLKHEFRNIDYVYVDKDAFDYLWRVNLNEECIVLPNIGANIGEVYYIEPLSLPFKSNVLGPNAILLKTKDSTKFMFTLLQADDFQNKLYISIASSGQPKFNKTELKSIKILMPRPDEQEQIGAYFSKLDHLIALHQRTLEEEKKKKKALQQLLLTGIVRV